MCISFISVNNLYCYFNYEIIGFVVYNFHIAHEDVLFLLQKANLAIKCKTIPSVEPI